METQTQTQAQTQPESIKESTEDLVNHAGDYLDTWSKKMLLKVTQKTVNAGAGFISAAVLAVLFLLVFMFASIGLALWVGTLVSSAAGGFFIIAGFYLLVALIFLGARKKSVIPSIRNSLIRKIYE
jgi:hypothetical protein